MALEELLHDPWALGKAAFEIRLDQINEVLDDVTDDCGRRKREEEPWRPEEEGVMDFIRQGRMWRQRWDYKEKR